VRAAFTRRDLPPRVETLRSLGFDPGRLTIFAQGGGEGSGGFARSVAAVLAAGAPQVMLAAGTNESLARQFAGAPGVRVIPFTNTIAPLMAAADIVLGKAGPNTLVESVTLGRPFVATAYIPGQERGNLDFIKRHGLGWVALTEREQRALVGRLLEDPAQLAEMRASVDRYAEWNTGAMASIADIVLGLIPSAVQAG
jgi:UDP-N-acetylglucosamine:LPS N-acetylglucosamine transferase